MALIWRSAASNVIRANSGTDPGHGSHCPVLSRNGSQRVQQIACRACQPVEPGHEHCTAIVQFGQQPRQLLAVLPCVVGAANATFRSLHDAWADTTTPHGRLIVTVPEGRKRARARGVLFGRPRKLMPHQRREAIARRDTGDETLTDIARSYNVSHSTISRL